MSINSRQSVELRRFVQSDPINPTISPDGKRLLFVIEYDSGDALDWAMMPLDGASMEKLNIPIARADVVYRPPTIKWGADGKSVLYVNYENGIGNIWSVGLDGGHTKQLTDFKSDQIFSFDVSSDNRLVVSRGTTPVDLVLLEKVR
jgi:Tol biopolymer transport system component